MLQNNLNGQLPSVFFGILFGVQETCSLCSTIYQLRATKHETFEEHYYSHHHYQHTCLAPILCKTICPLQEKANPPHKLCKIIPTCPCVWTCFASICVGNVCPLDMFEDCSPPRNKQLFVPGRPTNCLFLEKTKLYLWMVHKVLYI